MKIKLLLPILIFFAYSCDREIDITQETVAGTWRATAVESAIPNVPHDVLAAGEQELLSSVYSLHDDLSMELRSDFFKTGAHGNWELNPDAKELRMLYSYDTTQGNEKYLITYLSKKKIILRQDIRANEFRGTLELTLEK